jgi:hypothetical protein
MFSSAGCSLLSIEGFSHSLITKIPIEINADPQHWLHNTYNCQLEPICLNVFNLFFDDGTFSYLLMEVLLVS